MRQKQERDNRLLQAENDKFRRKIRLIKEDLSFIEWLARRDLGMIGEEEFQYWFED
jgi:cell division protein FtsB